MKKILLVFIALLFVQGKLSAQLAEDSEKFLGCILKHTKLSDSDFDLYFNQVTPENSGKWGKVESERDVMDWSYLDYIYNYAKEKGFPFKQHAFIWDLEQPEWISELSQEEQREEVEEWIQAFCERYPDVDMIEPVNEATRNPAPYKEALGGEGDTGYDWVINGFEMARQYAPDATLILNDYDVLKSGHVRDKVIDIANLLDDRDLVDAIGCQAHFLEGKSAEQIQDALDQLAATGLDIYITELDIHIADDQEQLIKYKEIFPAIWQHPAVKGVTLWGYKEGTMWRDDGYLLRDDGSERPAMTWVKEFFDGKFQSPYQEHDIPGKIEAENFDEGGQYYGYYDQTSGNSGNSSYRSDQEHVDINTTDDEGDGHAVVNIEDGEWLHYTINQVDAGTYDVKFRISNGSTSDDQAIKVLLNKNPLCTVGPSNTGGLDSWETVTVNEVTISPERENQVLRLQMEEGGFYLNYVEFVPTSSPSYSLTVNEGVGSGKYVENASVNITANEPPEGKEFDQWTGDVEHVEDKNAENTTVDMPAGEVTVKASFKDKPLYDLTVNNGSGDGSYIEGSTVEIRADEPPSDMHFDRWSGDTENVVDVFSPVTEITMPADNISVEALFSENLRVQLSPLDDSFVRSDSPDDIKGISDVEELNLRYRDPGGNNESIRYAYLKFEIPEIEDGSSIESAKLTLFGYNYSSADEVDFEVLCADNSWDEETLTWNNRPDFDESGAVIDYSYPLLNDEFGQFDIDVTPLIEGIPGEIVTIAIRIKNYVNNVLIKFASKESSSDPAPTLKLMVDGDVVTAAPAVSSEEDLMVHPNPVAKVLTVQGKKAIDTIFIYDHSGKLVEKQQGAKSEIQKVDVSGLKNTSYLIKVVFEDGNVGVEHVFKKE